MNPTMLKAQTTDHFLPGVFTAVTLTLQFNLFLEMPFAFNFPTLLFSFVSCKQLSFFVNPKLTPSCLVLSILVAIYGSYSPAQQFGKKQIAIALKGL
jgi:ABC-type lipoprotein release transport system permease subunit